MDVAVNIGEKEQFAKMMAHELVEETKPILLEMVKQAVKEYFPPHALTETEAKEYIRAKGTDKVTKEALARVTLDKIPSYPAGTQRRYWSGAIDKYLTEHNIP